MLDKPKVAVYCRVASANDFAITKQEETLCNYASDNGLPVVMVYSDNGANGLSFDRPAFQEMMAAVEGGELDCIISNDISRISRSHLHFGKWIDDMLSKNVRIILVGDNFDSKTYRFQHAPFEEAMMKYYKEAHSQKIKNGIAHAKRRRLEQAAKHSE